MIQCGWSRSTIAPPNTVDPSQGDLEPPPWDVRALRNIWPLSWFKEIKRHMEPTWIQIWQTCRVLWNKCLSFYVSEIFDCLVCISIIKIGKTWLIWIHNTDSKCRPHHVWNMTLFKQYKQYTCYQGRRLSSMHLSSGILYLIHCVTYSVNGV